MISRHRAPDQASHLGADRPYGQDPLHPGASRLTQTLRDAGLTDSPLHPWNAAHHLADGFTRRHAHAGLDGLDQAVDLLVRYDAIDLMDASGRTPLEGAIASTHPPVREALVRRLLAAGADPNHHAPAHDLMPGTTPLILAVQFNAPDALDHLLAAGAQRHPALVMGPFDPWGCETTALHEAVQRQNLPLLDRLLAAGANPQARDVRQRSPLLIATTTQFPTPSIEVIDRLIRAGADVNERLPNKARLQFAATFAPTPVLERLLAAGIDPNAREPVTRDRLLLRLSNAAVPNLDSVRALLKAGANPRSVNVYGNTALHFATSQFVISWPLVTMLVDAGASLRVINQDGDSPRKFLDDHLADLKIKSDSQHDQDQAIVKNLTERAILVRAMRQASRQHPVTKDTPDSRSGPRASPRRRL